MHQILKRSLAWVLANGILLSTPGWALLSRLSYGATDSALGMVGNEDSPGHTTYSKDGPAKSKPRSEAEPRIDCANSAKRTAAFSNAPGLFGGKEATYTDCLSNVQIEDSSLISQCLTQASVLYEAARTENSLSQNNPTGKFVYEVSPFAAGEGPSKGEATARTNAANARKKVRELMPDSPESSNASYFKAIDALVNKSFKDRSDVTACCQTLLQKAKQIRDKFEHQDRVLAAKINKSASPTTFSNMNDLCSGSTLAGAGKGGKDIVADGKDAKDTKVIVPPPPPPSNDHKDHGWIWWVIGAVVIGAIAAIVMSHKGGGTTGSSIKKPPKKSASSAAPTPPPVASSAPPAAPPPAPPPATPPPPPASSTPSVASSAPSSVASSVTSYLSGDNPPRMTSTGANTTVTGTATTGAQTTTGGSSASISSVVSSASFLSTSSTPRVSSGTPRPGSGTLQGPLLLNNVDTVNSLTIPQNTVNSLTVPQKAAPTK